MTSTQGDRDVIIFGGLGPVSRKSRELFRPEKPFIKVQPAYSVKLVFLFCKGNKNKNNCKVACLETSSF